ncbi:cytochrome c [Betaproteobacteria bacterium]|nr:cytochrome c [Betaproteobacteria bacterium]GHU42915.1 cytochrome c [Betaproteobacteria bacterium]
MKLWILSLTLLLAPMMATAAEPDGAKLYAEKTCTACHGQQGNKPLLPVYPKIAGQNAAYLDQQMKDIKSGARKNANSAAMQGIMHLVNEQEIAALAKYIATLKP